MQSTKYAKKCLYTSLKLIISTLARTVKKKACHRAVAGFEGREREIKILFLVTNAFLLYAWIRELWQEGKKPRKKPGDFIPGEKADDNSNAAEQFPEALNDSDKVIWRLDTVLVLLLIIGYVVLSRF